MTSSLKLHPKAQEIVDHAVELQWKAVELPTGKDSGIKVKLVSPLHDGVSIDVPPVRQWNDKRLRAMREKLIRYSDPKVVERVAREHQRNEARKAAQHERERAEQQAVLDEAQAAVEASSEADSEPMAVVPHVRPFVVRHGIKQGMIQVYDSHSVSQRTWPDGHVDFICPACDYSHDDNPWSVSVHYARTKDDRHTPRGTPPVYRLVTPAEYVAYTPVLSKNFSERTQAVNDEVQQVPLGIEDPESILAQIIALVAPDNEQQLAELRAEIDELTELLNAAETERDELQTRAAAERAELESKVAAAEARADASDAKLADTQEKLAGFREFLNGVSG